MSYVLTQRMVVSAVNANGEPDFYFVVLTYVPKDAYDDGLHYVKAKELAKAEGYEPALAYDECDITTTGLCNLFAWEAASRVPFNE